MHQRAPSVQFASPLPDNNFKFLERPVETRKTLRQMQARKLRDLLRQVRLRNPFYRDKLAAANFSTALLEEPRRGDEEGLRRLLDALPLTTKEELQRDQEAHPPYGTDLTYEPQAYIRLHQTSGTSSGPIRWLDTARSWQWFIDAWKEIYRAMRLRESDRLFFPFSFGPFIGFWAAFESAAQLGRFCLPGGGMSTAGRLRMLLENRITVVCSTPTYALRMAECATEEGLDLPGSAVRALIVAGEPGGSIDSTRRRIEEAWGARVHDHSGMTEMGPYGFECEERSGGLHVNEEEFIVEILTPGGLEPPPEGKTGELVLTNPGRHGSPLVRYRTGDLVLPRHTACACGREGVWLEGGILSRLDDMVFIRGNNVYPAVVESILRGFREVAEYRVRVLESGAMTDLQVELDPLPDLGEPRETALVERVAQEIRDRLHFRAAVRLVPPGTLPRFEMKARRFVRGTGK